MSPERPVNARLEREFVGTIPLELIYDGKDDEGIACWIADTPPLPGLDKLRVDEMPAKTKIMFPGDPGTVLAEAMGASRAITGEAIDKHRRAQRALRFAYFAALFSVGVLAYILFVGVTH